MVSPQNPNPSMGPNVSTTTTGRGFVTPEERQATVYQPEGGAPSSRSQISWGPVIAGSLLTISLLSLLASLAYTVGIPAFSYGEYGWGAGIWSIISAALAFFAGGCLSAYLAGRSDRPYGSLLHGVMVWALTIPLVMVLFVGVQGAFGQGGLIATNVARIIIPVVPSPLIAAASLDQGITGLSLTGAAWGAWLSMLTGLACAALGGKWTESRYRSS